MRRHLAALPLCLALGLAAAGPARAQFSDWYTTGTAAAADQMDQMQLLLNAHKDPNTSSQGRPALVWATNHGNVAMVKLLLQHGANPGERDDLGNTAMYWAADIGGVAIMELLLDAKSPVDAPNRQGITPLMVAVDTNHAAAVRFLVAHGADPHKQDYTGRDAFGWAAGKPNILPLLSARG